MILVTSASGHVGTSVVHALVKADQPVRAFVHSTNSPLTCFQSSKGLSRY
jgi:uncharacterized protein YbjT (DUF2867 family)